MYALSRITSTGRLLPLLLLAAALACSRDPIGPAGPAGNDPAGPFPSGDLSLASADGLIVFEAHVWGVNVYTMNPDGSSPTEVTNNSPNAPQNDVHPELSPDGTQIVFHRPTWYPVVGETDDIYVMNVDGSGLTNLTNSSGYSEREPTWSPDGSKIAFKSNRDDSSFSLFTMNSDGSSVTKIVATLLGGYESREPTWSPDGTQIAYTTNALEPYWLLCIVTIAGGGTSCATNPPVRFGGDIGGIGGTMGSFFNPDWGPDGRIAVTGNWGECSGCHRNDIFVMDSDFTDLTKISGQSGVAYFHPSWSPDGTGITYQEDNGSVTTGIGVMSADGTGKTIIRAGQNTAPHWGVDAGAPPPPPATQCSDGEDNDDDGRIDGADRGCSNPEDDSESPDPPVNTCREVADRLRSRARRLPDGQNWVMQVIIRDYLMIRRDGPELLPEYLFWSRFLMQDKTMLAILDDLVAACP